MAAHILLRANPAYELVEYSRLGEDERAGLDGLLRDDTFFGVLRPMTESGSVKAVCRNTALLWYALREPGPPPEYLMRSAAPDEVAEALRDLIADSVLQRWDGTAWHDGPVPAKSEPADGRDPLGQAALTHGAMLVRCGERDPLALSLRLYAYHHEPLSPRQRRALVTPAELLAYAGLDRVSGDWDQSVPGPTDPWVRWRPVGRRPARARYKAYVSPDMANLRSVLPRAVRLAGDVGAAGFKLGGTPTGISRPDRFVVYFSDHGSLTDFANGLRASVGGLDGRGVPFTAALGDDGLVSWGMDPDPVEATVPWLGGSWRRQVTDVLATAMVHADGDNSVAGLVAAAGGVAAGRGIDPFTWTFAGVRHA